LFEFWFLRFEISLNQIPIFKQQIPNNIPHQGLPVEQYLNLNVPNNPWSEISGLEFRILEVGICLSFAPAGVPLGEFVIWYFSYSFLFSKNTRINRQDRR